MGQKQNDWSIPPTQEMNIEFQDPRRILITCHGKVLISGGYCILEEGFSGIVICPSEASGTCLIETEEKTDNSKLPVTCFVQVHCKLGICTFQWNGNFDISDSFFCSPFIKSAFQVVSEYLRKKDAKQQSLLPYKSIKLHIELSPVFYTQKAGKTGLGSSAVVTVLTIGAILALLDQRQINLETVYHLALHSHFAAQGKIGSGFDISAAVFGSQLFFKREAFDFSSTASSGNYSRHIPIELPPHVKISLCLLGNGTSTVSFVKKFLEFKQNKPKIIWPILLQIERLTHEIHQNLVNAQLEKLPYCSEQLLQAYNELSREIQLQILPEIVRQKCLHFLRNEPSILCAGIAGAGGFDAFYLLYDCRVKNWPFILNFE